MSTSSEHQSNPGQDIYWAEFEEKGLPFEGMREMDSTLNEDFRAADWGFRQLTDITNLEQRAVVSDQIAQAASAIPDNLLEMKSQLEALNETCDGAFRHPSAETAAMDGKQTRMARMNVTDFFRAAGSTLDCMAAVSIGILRTPLSIEKASFSQLIRGLEMHLKGDVPQHQRNSTANFDSMIESVKNDPWPGWLSWTSDMRNVCIHRARRLFMMLPVDEDKPSTKLHVVTDNPYDVLMSTSRYMPHLPTKPALPELLNLGTSSGINEVYLNEDAVQTASAISFVVTDLVEKITAQLVDIWQGKDNSPANFKAPECAWQLPEVQSATFQGTSQNKQDVEADFIVMSPGAIERPRLAEAIRAERSRNKRD